MRTLLILTIVVCACGERGRRDTPVLAPPAAGDAAAGDGQGGEGAAAEGVAEGEGEQVEPVGPAPTGEGEGEGEVGDACADDPLEPNDSARAAHRILARSERGLVLCPDDEDWFVLDIDSGDGARAGVFADGVRLELRNDAGVILAVVGGGEQAEAAVVDGEQIYVRVSDAEAPTPYDLFFEVVAAERPEGGEAGGEGEIEDPGGACVDDQYEPNPDPGQARPLGAGLSADLALCPGNEDWFSVQVGQGQRLTVAIEFDHAVGDLDLYLYGAGGPPDVLGLSEGGANAEVVFVDAADAQQVFVQVVGFAGAGNGHYDLTALLGEAPAPCQGDEHEPNESRFAAERLQAGDHGGLTVCEVEDEDWFFVDLDEADDLEITLTFRSHEGNLNLDLHNPAGARVARSATLRPEEIVRYRAERAGRHAFRVYARTVRGGEGAPYQLEIAVESPEDRCGRDDGMEPNDSRNAAEDLDPGTYRGLQLCFEDEDWYALDLNGGDEFEINLRFDDDEGDIDMQLFEPGSNSVWERSESHSDNERVTGVAEEAGEHLLRVFGEEAAYDLIFEVNACEPDDAEENDDRAHPHRLNAGRHLNLSQCGPDEDWFSVDIDEGDDLTARIDFRSNDGNLDLHLLAPGGGGQPLDRSESAGSREEVTWRAGRDGAHLLRVFPRRAGDADAVPYELTITHTTAADRCPRDRSEANDSRGAARDIRQGTTRDLTLCGDEDWFEIDLDEGDEVEFAVRYDALGDGAPRVDLELVDPAGREEDDDRGSAGRASVSHVATRDGDHHLRVFAIPAAAEFEYEVTVSVSP